MKALSTSEEQVMAALWACGKPATRRQIAAKLPPDCVWADSTLLNFLLRLEAKGYVRPEKQGNKNIYTPLVRRVTYCGAVSAAHLQTLYGGDLRSMVAAVPLPPGPGTWVRQAMPLHTGHALQYGPLHSRAFLRISL